MKKVFIIFILILVVGCKSNSKEKMVCNNKTDNREDQVIIYLDNDKSVSYDKKSTITLDNSIDAINYKTDDNYDAFEVVDNKVLMYVSESLDDMTKLEVKSLYENVGYMCK